MSSPNDRLKTVRTLLWVLVGLAIIGVAALFLIPRQSVSAPTMTQTTPVQASFGGPFTLVGADGKPFSSSALTGKPHVMFFGFTRCGDVCPTTLSRLVNLRKQAGGEDKFAIVFVTIDPKHDGPEEVGQYEAAFNSPIIGLTGSPEQIDKVKKQYGIFAEPSHHPTPGQEMDHTATVLLFDRDGKFVSTIAPGEPDSAALDKLKRITT
jgi:protein SCO1/2